MSGITPSQTVGPYWKIGMEWPDGGTVAGLEGQPGIVIEGRVLDAAGVGVSDGLVESWQADPEGRYAHPLDPQGGSQLDGFVGFARAPTRADGSFRILTAKPGPAPGPGNGLQAPHLLLSVFARGMLDRVVTRLYFPNEPLNAGDAVLNQVPADRRGTLIATAQGDGRYTLDIRLQGEGETVFFLV